MGCTPTAVKDKTKIPPINSYPSNRLMTSPTSLENIVAAASRMTARDYDEIGRYDLVIKEERPTPTKIERIDFVNKQYVTG